MAEALAAVSVVASVAQLADYGFKLSVKLFTFGQTVYYAERSVNDISTDVSLTSSVLKELGDTLKRDDEAKLISEQAVLAAEQTVKECLRVFKELDEVLTNSMGKMGFLGSEGKKKSKGAVALEKLKWPFMQPKMDLLRSNLDRLKASLSLMLNVLIYARGLREKESSSQYQKEIVEGLARTERDSRERFEALKKTIEAGDLPRDNDQATNDSDTLRDFTINTNVPSETPPDQELIKTADHHEAFVDYCYMVSDLLRQITYMKRILDHECCGVLETAIEEADAVVTGRLERRYGVAFKTVYDQIKATRGCNMAKAVVVDDEVDEVMTEVVVEQEQGRRTSPDVDVDLKPWLEEAPEREAAEIEEMPLKEKTDPVREEQLRKGRELLSRKPRRAEFRKAHDEERRKRGPWLGLPEESSTDEEDYGFALIQANGEDDLRKVRNDTPEKSVQDVHETPWNDDAPLVELFESQSVTPESSRGNGVQLEEILCDVRVSHEEHVKPDEPEELSSVASPASSFPFERERTPYRHSGEVPAEAEDDDSLDEYSLPVERERKPYKAFGEVPVGVEDVKKDEETTDNGPTGKDEEDERNVVATLLSMWTTLPAEQIAQV